MAETQLANLVKMDSPQAVLDEAIIIISLFSPDTEAMSIRSAFDQTVALYRGQWEGVKACNTDYHDLKHVTDCFLAMVRLFHGAATSGVRFGPDRVYLGVVAALLHDVGYLQYCEDSVGTGAKYTLSHVRRGMDFVQRHYAAFGIPEEDLHACMAMIHCTDIHCDPAVVPFPDPGAEQMGKMLATADLLSQMADRTYLEKLLFLFYELDEAHIDTFSDEVDMLRRSKHFYGLMVERIDNQLAASNRWMIGHFKARWNIDEDLYQRAIDNQRTYLSQILQTAGGDPRDRLRRSRIVEAVRSRYN